MKKNSTQWTSKLGFVLATAGAAVGLGNLWKFPYLMGANGGFSFLIAYLVFILILGVPVMIMEMALGRKTRHDPVQAYQDVHPHAKIVGVFGVLAAFFIDRKQIHAGTIIFPIVTTITIRILTPLIHADTLLHRVLFCMAGIGIIAMSIALSIYADCGKNPYDCVTFGLMKRTGLILVIKIISVS